MVHTEYAKQALAMLNAAQRRAVETIEGPVMVVAGPGTGKTQVLASRIANILLTTDTQPHAILALTFTDSAAQNMRERVVRMIGKAGYYVTITTFHSFCKEVLSSHPEYFPLDRQSKPLSVLESYHIFEEIITQTPLEVLKPLNTPFFYISEVISAISTLKREGFAVQDFRQVVEKEFAIKLTEGMTATQAKKHLRTREKNLELARIYGEYEVRIRQALRYDFDDMVMLVKQAFTNHELLLREYQERFLYVLVDEYQDTNSAQNAVVHELVSYWQGEQPNIFVVGDPHQSIYRFQGASVENVFSFMRLYPEAEIITLDTGYRCPQDIYTVAHSVIGNNDLTKPLVDTQYSLARTAVLDAISHRLVAPPKSGITGPFIQVCEAPSQVLEHVWLANSILELQKQGVPSEEIAVLYRTNKEGEDIERVLAKWQIQYRLDTGYNILKDEYIQQFLQLLRLVHAVSLAQEDALLFEVLCYEWVGIEPLSIMKVSRYASQKRMSIYDVIMTDETKAVELGLQDAEWQSMRAYLEAIQNWSIASNAMAFTQWFEHVLNESRYMEFVLKHDNHLHMISHLNVLFAEVKGWVDSNSQFRLLNFIQAIDTMQEWNIGIIAQDMAVAEGAVTLTTVHKAKGREWSYVFIVHCVDGVWGNRRKNNLLPLPTSLLNEADVSQKEQNEDERRLFYVAITRAKHRVYISHSQRSGEGATLKPTLPAMFIGEMQEYETLQPDFQSLQEQLGSMLQPVAEKKGPSEEAFFAELVKKYTLSVTGLNKYLSDPYEFKLDVLLRIPKAKQEHMVFGTAIHSALEVLYRPVLAGQQLAEFEIVTQAYRKALQSEAMAIADYERRLAYGMSVLETYYASVIATQHLPDIHSLELKVGGSSHVAMMGDIAISGRFDRVDWIDRDKKLVRVIDYKTGKAKSENDIEARTATALKNLSEREQMLPEAIRGPYKRQLLFYKLLLEAVPQFNLKVSQGIFDFVEPTVTGLVMSRAFTLKEADVKELRELIIVVMQEIRSLQFLDAQPTK